MWTTRDLEDREGTTPATSSRYAGDAMGPRTYAPDTARMVTRAFIIGLTVGLIAGIVLGLTFAS